MRVLHYMILREYGACAGVVQMNAGIVHSLFNQLYFRDSLSTWCGLDY